MPTDEMFTQLPTVSNANMSDIICAVQGYVSSSVPGLSVQETLGQVYTLFQSNVILFNAGDPNGAVAGNTYQLCWDTTDTMLWVCTQTGSSSTAIWTKSITLTAGSGITISQAGATITISGGGSGFTWNSATGATQAMTTNSGYQSNRTSALLTYTLPTVSSFGDTIYVLGGTSSGWIITQAASQQIVIGGVSSTAGVSGSVASTLPSNSLELICTTPNLIWQVPNSPQGILTIV